MNSPTKTIAQRVNFQNNSLETPKTGNIKLPKKDNSFIPVIELSPSNIRNTILNGSNIEIQRLIDKLLKSDSHFLGKFQDRLSVIRKAQFNWKPASEDQRDIDFCEEIKTAIEPKLTKKVLKHLLKSIFRRFSVSEIVWQQNSNKYDFYLKNLPQSGFEYSNKISGKETEDISLYLYDVENETSTKIPSNKVLIAESDLVFEGETTSISEIIAILIVIKFFALQKDWTRFNELFGLPMRLGTYEQNASPTDINRLFEALSQLGSSAAGVIGGLTKIDFLQPKNNDPKMFKEIIQLCNEEISKAIIGQSGTSGTGKEATYASMKVLNGVREDIAQDSLDLISDVINEQLIGPYILYNYGHVENAPKLSFDLPVNYNDYLTKDKGLKDLGVKFNKSYFQKRYNLSEDDFEIEEKKENSIFGDPKNSNPEFIEGLDNLNNEITNLKKKVENPFF